MVLNERLVRIEYKTYSRTKREREAEEERERDSGFVHIRIDSNSAYAMRVYSLWFR